MGGAYKDFDWYRTPLYYDIIFDADTDKEVRFIEALYQRHIGSKGRKRILEPACGSGRLLAPLAQRGYKVTGFDLSPSMIAFARKRLTQAGAKGGLSVQSMQYFRYPHRFDLAYCFVSTFKYLLTEQDARAHLESVATHLRPGGVYLLGFHLSDYDRTTRERERWVAQRNGTHVVCNIQSWPPNRRRRLETVRSRLVVTEEGAPPVRYETTWTFRTYNHKQFKRLLKSVPQLRMVACHDFYYQPDVTLDFDAEPAGVVLVLKASASASL